jgi:dTDP-3,4-didehydro-2,6-dideoxy-alpha-D-glucose 3-reductase
VKALNIAVWGVGHHAINRIIPALLLMKNIKLVGICTRNEGTISQCIKDFDCIGWNHPVEMLNCSGVDVIYIASPIGLHAEQAKLALRAGKHVWCEKPLTCNHSDTISLVNIAKKRELMLTEGFMFLYHPQFKYLQKFVQENQNSGIKSIVCRFGIPSLDKPGFRNDPNLCGGALWDVGSYTVAASLALFPDQKVKVVFSEIVKKYNDVDSEGRAILKFSKGASAYLEWGVGVSYKNELDIWANENSIFTDKIFSKPKNYHPIFYKRNITGKMIGVNGEESEQFQDMFLKYNDLLSSQKKINTEYKEIIHRSKIMDEIIKVSKINEIC